MKPASSIIIFTVFSGFGFGLFFWLGLNLHTPGLRSDIIFFTMAFTFSIAGLISSSFHLGNPQRALRAFTQWKSSWLSREAILAVLTLILNFFYAVAIIIFDIHISWFGILCAGFSLITIFSTSMIYAQMKSVPRWNMSVVPPLFLFYGITGTSIVLNNFFVCSILIFVQGTLQIFSWKLGDKKFKEFSHIGTATGLSQKRNVVRMLEPPHTGSNYLLKEMVFIVAQKHIHKLRWIALILFAILPFLISAGCVLLQVENFAFLVAIATINLLGTFVSRWLFFSEAEHVVGLYYDR